MDLFLIFKVLILGLVWTGSFYLTAAYILPIFPIPALHYIRKRLQLWSDNIAWLDEKKAQKRWRRSKIFFRFLLAMLWLSIVLGCGYLLLPILKIFLVEKNPNFWYYYSLAVLVPFCFSVYWGIKLFKGSKKKLPLSSYQRDDRPAIDRIKRPVI